MKQGYQDIKAKIKEPPLWYDFNGVPRYHPFSPDLCPDIYAEEVALLEIACQWCREHFFVQISWNRNSPNRGIRLPLPQGIRHYLQSKVNGRNDEGEAFCPLHYGDPPAHEGCLGETMNCYDLRVVEFWSCDPKAVWLRGKQFEIELEKLNSPENKSADREG